MKKTITTLLIAAITSVLCFAQVAPSSTTPAQKLVADLNAATTITQVAALEITLAEKLPSFTPLEINGVANTLRNAYMRAAGRGEVVNGYWIISVLPKYIVNWDTSALDGVYAYYVQTIVIPAFNQLKIALLAAKTPAALDAAVSAYFGTNILPERLHRRDSRQFSMSPAIANVAAAATRVGHPEALNYTLLAYRTAHIQSKPQVEGSISKVAAALKAKDFSLIRANAWIESQNTGTPAVTFSDEERAVPTALSSVAQLLPDFSLATAKEAYRSAESAYSIDIGIYAIADALKALDLNLARANAWIAAQKNGTAFDLP